MSYDPTIIPLVWMLGIISVGVAIQGLRCTLREARNPMHNQQWFDMYKSVTMGLCISAMGALSFTVLPNQFLPSLSRATATLWLVFLFTAGSFFSLRLRSYKGLRIVLALLAMSGVAQGQTATPTLTPTQTPTAQYVATFCITPGPNMRVVSKTSSGGFCPSGSLTDDQSTYKVQRSNDGSGNITVSNGLVHFSLGSLLLTRLPSRAALVAQISAATATDNYPGQSGRYSLGLDKWVWNPSDLSHSYTCALCSGASPVSPPCQPAGTCVGGGNPGSTCYADAACDSLNCNAAFNSNDTFGYESIKDVGDGFDTLSVGSHTFELNSPPTLNNFLNASQTDFWLRMDVHGGPFVTDEADGMEPTPTGVNELTLTQLCLVVESNDDNRTATPTRTPTITQTPTNTPVPPGCCQIHGYCNVSTTTECTTSADCPGGESCSMDGFGGATCLDTLVGAGPITSQEDCQAVLDFFFGPGGAVANYFNGATNCDPEGQAGGVCAAVPTATPTSPAGGDSPTATPAVVRTPQGGPALADKRTDSTTVLLSGATAVATSGGAFIGGAKAASIEVSVGSCTSYTLVIEGSNNCANYGTLQTMTQSDVGASTPGFATTITRPMKCVRARITAISSCTITAVVHAVP